MTRTWLCCESAILWKYLEINLNSLESSGIALNTIGDKLRYNRTLKEWSQRDLAEKIGYPSENGRCMIKDYENNICFINKDVSEKLAKIFNLTTKYFYDDYFEFLEVAPIVLKKFRKNSNLTKKAAASLVGTGYSMWSRWEKGYTIGRNCYEKLKCLLKQS